jgi:hypothetical protein
MPAMKTANRIKASSAPHRAVETGIRSTAMTISAIGSAIPPARVNRSGTPNARMALWEPDRSKSLETPDTTNTAARIRRAASNNASMRSNPCMTKCETPSVGQADGNPRRGWSSVGKVYHRAGTHPERRTAIWNRRSSNTNQREALDPDRPVSRLVRLGRLQCQS